MCGAVTHISSAGSAAGTCGTVGSRGAELEALSLAHQGLNGPCENLAGVTTHVAILA
jgi:hypothetical protein